MDDNLPQRRPKSKAQLEHHHRTHKRRKTATQQQENGNPTGNSAFPTPTPTPTPTQQPRATSLTTPPGCDSDDDMPDLLWLNPDQADLQPDLHPDSSNPTCPPVLPDARWVFSNIHAANHQCLVEGIVALANFVETSHSNYNSRIRAHFAPPTTHPTNIP